ncbi:prepilin-type N-terminal cleavage/methylation domain-containing protein [Vibrio splendidus]|uniref:pilus assembly FimT family protein n=1 Tax=Vibrio splendidus TaxID=29497 RepID=UPI00223575EC|nr:prepilin-type N-terminal cleavage/methylation domain-containing protein [Vibrio splendidus]MCW4446352.1 prepilin-type N-terminal cleavage/methylation domain-containing protein [Vibrio splendidus]
MRPRGFTLIELLIVLTLMALAATLVGPATINQVEKAEARAELNQLKSTLRKTSSVAFARGGGVALQVYNNELVLLDLTKEPVNTQSHLFKFIGFPEEQIVAFNHNGYPDPESLIIVFRGARKEINLFRLVEATE